MQQSNSILIADNKAEIAPVKVYYETTSFFGRVDFHKGLDIQQCSNETKGRILKSYIDDTDFND